MAPPKDASDYRVIAVRVGTRATERSEVYLNYRCTRKTTERQPWTTISGSFKGPEETVVVDTGFGEEAGRRRGRTLLLHPADALARLGIDPTSIDDVIVTHGHYDHIGNLGLFPNARIHMAEAEYRFWTSPTAGHLQFSFYSEEDEIDQLRLAEAEGRLKLFSGETAPAPGLRLVEVGGHTPGQAIVYVPTTEGEVLLASDAVHFYEEVERDMPFTAISDLPAMYEAFAIIREEIRERGLTVIAGHDPDVPHALPRV